MHKQKQTTTLPRRQMRLSVRRVWLNSLIRENNIKTEIQIEYIFSKLV